MDRSERFQKVISLINELRVVTFSQLERELEVSPATIKRDLEYLRERFGAPVVYDRSAGGYRYEQPDKSEPTFHLPGLWFNSSEAYALLMMQHLLNGVEPGLLGPHIAPLKKRLTKILGSQEDDLDDIANRIRLVHLTKQRTDLKHFELVASALLKRRRLELHCWNRETNRETMHEASPQRLVYYRDNWYLDSWCHTAGAITSFAVDSIRQAALIEMPAREIKSKVLDATFQAGYGVHWGTDVEWAKLRFTPERARWTATEEWHPNQRSQFDSDGYYILEIPYSSPVELVMDILRQGDGVEVISPPDLRTRVQVELEMALAKYKNLPHPTKPL